VLTLTRTGLAADSALANRPGAKPHRRLGSTAAMLAGAAVGAAILQWSPPAALAIAALLVAGVAATFATAHRSAGDDVGPATPDRRSPAECPRSDQPGVLGLQQRHVLRRR
jgi:uncharacterized membrane protein YfcA